ncbi:MAG: hypothetical protein HZC02_02015 [Candidatus Levybacteria bacterium]|nr:hypothetical protein [Candidatus Levybacteria bacterium]
MPSGTDRRIFGIKNGPSKWEFMLSLFDGIAEYPECPQRTVCFTLDNSRLVNVRIMGAEREGRSDEHWKFWGYASACFFSEVTVKVKGSFATTYRNGELQFVTE